MTDPIKPKVILPPHAQLMPIDDDTCNANRHVSLITEWVDGIPTRVFRIKNPSFTEKGFYRAAVSANAFGNRQAKRFYHQFMLKRKQCPLRYHVQHYVDFALSRNALIETAIKHSQQKIVDRIPEIIEAGTIFDFYGLIGYDHRRQRFNVQTQSNQSLSETSAIL